MNIKHSPFPLCTMKSWSKMNCMLAEHMITTMTSPEVFIRMKLKETVAKCYQKKIKINSYPTQSVVPRKDFISLFFLLQNLSNILTKICNYQV